MIQNTYLHQTVTRFIHDSFRHYTFYAVLGSKACFWRNLIFFRLFYFLIIFINYNHKKLRITSIVSAIRSFL